MAMALVDMWSVLNALVLGVEERERGGARLFALDKRKKCRGALAAFKNLVTWQRFYHSSVPGPVLAQEQKAEGSAEKSTCRLTPT